MRYVPVIVGLLGCFATDTRYTIGGETFATRIVGDYTGWPAIVILILLGIYIFWKQKTQKPEFWIIRILSGVYLLGFVLFRLYQTFTLYENAAQDSLATQMQATATPGEGLYLLAISAIWVLFDTFRLWKKSFSTTHE